MPFKFQKVSDVLPTLMKGYGLGAKTHEYRILKIWDEAVGDKISSHTQPLRLIRRVLTVAVDSPAWIHQLNFYKNDLIERINNVIGKDAVEDISFKIGKVNKETGHKTKDPGLKTNITSLQSKKIEGYLEPIKDSEIRGVIKKVITKAMIRGKDKD